MHDIINTSHCDAEDVNFHKHCYSHAAALGACTWTDRCVEEQASELRFPEQQRHQILATYA